MTDERWLDPELERILEGDAALGELARRIRASRPEPPLDPRFSTILRAQLMREAQAGRVPAPPPPARAPTVRAWRGWWRPHTRIAFGGGAIALAMVAATVVSVFHTTVQDHQVTVTAMSPVAERHAVSPNNAITVSFSQPMNTAAVVAGLHIQPATEVTTSWQGNNLVITPLHHLAGNTPYTVTIDRNAAKAASGTLAASAIRIAFGTAPTPPVAAAVAQLSPQTLAAVNPGAQLAAASGSSIIVTSSNAVTGGGPPLHTPPPAQSPLPPASSTPALSAGPSPTSSASPGGTSSPSPGPSDTPSPSPSPSPSATPTPTATPTQTPSPSPSPSPSQLPSAQPVLSGNMVIVTGRGGIVDLGPAASSAALSPNGLRVVAAIPSAAGSIIEVAAADGSRRTALTTLAAPVLAIGWLSNGTAVVAEADRIVTVDLLGHVNPLTPLPAGTTSVVIAAAGGQAFAGAPGQDGTLIDLHSTQTRTLPGSRSTAAFSGDGAVVAWVDASGSAPRLLTSPVAHDAAISIPLSRPGDSIPAIALDKDGSHAVIVDEPTTGGGSLDVITLTSGTVIATGPDGRAPVYSGAGDHIAFVAGSVVQGALVPGVTPGTAVNVLPDSAAATLRAFVDAQVAGDSSRLQSLSAPGLGTQGPALTGLSRAYVISASANPDGSVSALVRLIVDPTAQRAAASFADESLVLTARRGTYLVSRVTAGALRDEPVGPHVVSVLPISGPTLVLRVGFDSDLRAQTVASAITVTNRAGHALAATTVYNPDDRTATVTLQVQPGSTVTVSVNTSLVDVDGQSMAAAFSANTGG